MLDRLNLEYLLNIYIESIMSGIFFKAWTGTLREGYREEGKFKRGLKDELGSESSMFEQISRLGMVASNERQS